MATEDYIIIPLDNVIGFSGYGISRQGVVWSYKTNRALKVSSHIRGYQKVSFRNKSKHPTWSIHRLIAMMFIPNPLNLPEVNHLNGIKSDNRIDNLEWCTPSQNMKHAYSTGLVDMDVIMKNLEKARKSDGLQRWYRRLSGPPRLSKNRQCSIEGCFDKHDARGLCKKHYMKMIRGKLIL